MNSQLGVAAGPLLGSKWVEGYARLGFDILTYATVRSRAQAAHPLPNIRRVEGLEKPTISARRTSAPEHVTVAVSLGLPSAEPEVWRKDMRRAKERIGQGQILVASVVGSAEPGADAEAFVEDYVRCAVWAADAGADVIEVYLAVPNPFGEPGQMVYESLPMSAQILYRVRSRVALPVIAKFGLFRNPRVLHETASTLAPWSHGYVLVSGVPRRVVDEEGKPAFEGAGREIAEIVGAATFPLCVRHVEELLAWRKAGAWEHPILAAGGITTVERAQAVLREGANVVLVATAALFDPLFASRFHAAAVSAA